MILYTHLSIVPSTQLYDRLIATNATVGGGGGAPVHDKHLPHLTSIGNVNPFLGPASLLCCHPNFTASSP